MANQNYNDVFTLTLESRSRSLADNVSKNNALLTRLKDHGNLRPISGGSKILEELEYGEGDMVWYSGYDTITYTPKQLFSAAEYALKLCAVPVAVSGEELLINSGHEQIMDLLEKRIANAEKTMRNKLSAALFGDGTESSGKSIGGLALLVADDPTSGTVGGINRATTGNEFWRNQSLGADLTSANIRSYMDKLYLNCSRGTDKPDLIVCDDTLYSMYESAVSELQRFLNPNMADAGFVTLKYKGADVVFDGGQGGNCPSKHMYFLNTNYIYLRSHKDRNMKVFGGERMAINQDAMYKIIGWAGNLTMSNAATQGVLIDTTSDSVSGGTEETQPETTNDPDTNTQNSQPE